jgi:hypothetical protein
MLEQLKYMLEAHFIDRQTSEICRSSAIMLKNICDKLSIVYSSVAIAVVNTG